MAAGDALVPCHHPHHVAKLHRFLLLSHADFEPRQLFNVVQFIMTDETGRGIMTLEEAMQILYLRNGRVGCVQHAPSLPPLMF